MLPTVFAVLAGCLIVPPARAQQSAKAPASAAAAPWHFRADWAGGYASWMSFPLSQDVGYDPSLYTEEQGKRTVLVRTFTAHGEKTAWVGVVRPLQFQADPQSSCEITYELQVQGAMESASLIFVAASGHHYSAALPSGNGEHRVRISGAQLGLKGQSSIVAVVLKGSLLHPPAASQSQWILQEFGIDARRTPAVALRQPALQASSDGGQISTDVIQPGNPLNVAWNESASPTRISLFSPSGTPAFTAETGAGASETSIPLPSPAAGLWRAQIEQGNARTEFNFLVLGAIPPHPRVLLSEKRLEQLRGPQYASLRQQIHARAENLAGTIRYDVAAGDNIELMPSGPGIQPAFPDQIKPYFKLMDSYSGAVAYSALDYRLNGDTAALAAARRALLTMARWRTWVPPRFRSHGLQTYYEVGIAAQLAAFGYDLIADRLSDQDKKTVEQAFWTQAIAPVVQEYFVADRDPIGASNFMANSLGGALAAAVAVAGDTPEWRQREAPAIGELDFAFERLLHGLFPGDGSEAEPVGYENFAMQGLSWGMSALAALQVRPQGAERMLQGFWWPFYATVVPGTQLDTGDFNGHLTKLPGFAWTAEYAGIPELRAYYESESPLDLSHGASVGNNGHFLEEMPGPLNLVCCTAPVKTVSPPPPSRVFPKRGSAVLRSGWGADSTVISLRAGPWFNHDHHDEGSFQVAALGQTLINEAGYARYYLDPRYQDYFSQAPGHNTLLLDGDAFSQQAINGRYWPGFATPSFRSHLLANDFDYLDTDLAPAYDGKLQSYRREFFFLKPGVLVVRDRVRAAEPHAFSWLLHVSPQAKLVMADADASVQMTRAAAWLRAIGPNTQWTIETAPLPIALFDDLDQQPIQPRRVLQLTSAKASSTQFLVAMNIGPGSAADDLRMERLSEPAGDGLRSGDQATAMIFRTGPGMLSISDLSTDGSALLVRGGRSGGTADWMAVEARIVQDGNRNLVRSAVPVDLAVEHRGTRLELTVHNAAPASLQVHCPVAPSRVEVDGREVRAPFLRGAITLSLPAPGEHHVSIQ